MSYLATFAWPLDNARAAHDDMAQQFVILDGDGFGVGDSGL